MRIPDWPVRIVKSGEISVIRNSKEAIRFTAKEGVLDVDLVDDALLKGLLKLDVEPEIGSIIKALKETKGFAERLREEKLTLTVSQKGRSALKLGDKANPKFSRLITFSGAVEVKSMTQLLRIVKAMR